MPLSRIRFTALALLLPLTLAACTTTSNTPPEPVPVDTVTGTSAEVAGKFIMAGFWDAEASQYVELDGVIANEEGGFEIDLPETLPDSQLVGTEELLGCPDLPEARLQIVNGLDVSSDAGTEGVLLLVPADQAGSDNPTESVVYVYSDREVEIVAGCQPVAPADFAGTATRNLSFDLFLTTGWNAVHISYDQNHNAHYATQPLLLTYIWLFLLFSA